MSVIVHRANSRGVGEHGWLSSRHTFSFAGYLNPNRMGFGTLRVINEDVIQPGMGFDTHPHRDMEIVSVPISGKLAHKDTLGNAYTIHSDEIQVMTAGTGIRHSEYNASQEEEAHFLQIWILPEKNGHQPGYDQKRFPKADRLNQLQLVASPDAQDESLRIGQRAYVSLVDLEEGSALEYKPYREGNGLYVFVKGGQVEVGETELHTSDGAGITDLSDLKIRAKQFSELLLLEVPMA